jgi:hypothetical protein
VLEVLKRQYKILQQQGGCTQLYFSYWGILFFLLAIFITAACFIKACWCTITGDKNKCEVFKFIAATAGTKSSLYANPF